MRFFNSKKNSDKKEQEVQKCYNDMTREEKDIYLHMNSSIFSYQQQEKEEKKEQKKEEHGDMYGSMNVSQHPYYP